MEDASQTRNFSSERNFTRLPALHTTGFLSNYDGYDCRREREAEVIMIADTAMIE